MLRNASDGIIQSSNSIVFKNKEGAKFARNIVSKYQAGGRAQEWSKTQVAGDDQYPLYDWNAFVSEPGVIENLLNDIYGEDGSSIQNNLNNYNTYNSEFFKLKKELFGSQGFTKGTRFRRYDPAQDYLRMSFNDTNFGKSINSHFKDEGNPRKEDLSKNSYLDYWWGT
jgi:hypothetical protein